MKIGIVTFTEGYNYGNKLQNFALLRYLEENFQYDVRTVHNLVRQGKKWSKAKILLAWLFPSKKHFMYWKRLYRFQKFNQDYLKFTKEKLRSRSKKFDEVDFFVCGSDQIWNPNYYENIDLLTGNLRKQKPSISYAASFGVNQIPADKEKAFARALANLKAVSVREGQGLKICKQLGIEKGIVSIDPTFLLDREEWLSFLVRPQKNLPSKFIVTYFLGNLSGTCNAQIDAYCKSKNCSRIDLNSVHSLEWFDLTPFEFLYMIEHAEFIFTDSFHASVFSIIFGKKFMTVNRVESKENQKMNSRIDTLFSLFSCENHRMRMKADQSTAEEMAVVRSMIDESTVDASKVREVVALEKEKTHKYFLENLVL